MLADLCVLVVVLGRLTPFSGILPAFAGVPFAVLASRHRIRAVAIGGVVAVVIGFLLAGFGAATTVVVSALWGSVAGRGSRHGWGPLRTAATSLAVGWTAVAGSTLAVLAIFAGIRRLTIESIEVQWAGLARGLRSGGLGAVADAVDPVVAAALDRWWLTVPVLQLGLALGLTLLVGRFSGPVLRRVAQVAPPDPAVVPPPAEQPERIPAPVPVRLRQVEVRRGGRAVLAIDDLTIEPGALLVLVGDNGAGKSTLLSVLAGAPAPGRIDRPGAPGLGAPGGTAVVGQRPESQVVGARVGDDLAWGLPHRPPVDELEAALARVGLDVPLERETAVLSGGQLQRLALAGALLRRPALLLSDESTAMLDPDGRAEVVALLRRLADDGVAVVHATHLTNERAVADRVVELRAGEVAR